MLRRSSHDTLDSLDPLRPSHAERDVLLGSKSSNDVAMFKLPSSSETSESMVSCCVLYREGRLCVFKQNEWTNACVSRIQWVGLNSAFEEEASLWWDARRERAGNALVLVLNRTTLSPVVVRAPRNNTNTRLYKLYHFENGSLARQYKIYSPLHPAYLPKGSY